VRATEQVTHAEEREREQARFSWLTLAEAGRLAGDVHADTVKAWIAAGELRALNIGTTSRPKYRIKPEWLDACIARRTLNGDAA
jgi:hypothetical protein